MWSKQTNGQIDKRETLICESNKPEADSQSSLQVRLRHVRDAANVD